MAVREIGAVVSSNLWPPHSVTMASIEYHALKRHSHLDLFRCPYREPNWSSCVSVETEWVRREWPVSWLRVEHGAESWSGVAESWGGVAGSWGGVAGPCNTSCVRVAGGRGRVDTTGRKLGTAGSMNSTSTKSCHERQGTMLV